MPYGLAQKPYSTADINLFASKVMQVMAGDDAKYCQAENMAIDLEHLVAIMDQIDALDMDVQRAHVRGETIEALPRLGELLGELVMTAVHAMRVMDANPAEVISAALRPKLEEFYQGRAGARKAKSIETASEFPCQVLAGTSKLECDWRDSGGVGCERTGPHEDHFISEHTIQHDLMGNGYSCEAIKS